MVWKNSIDHQDHKHMGCDERKHSDNNPDDNLGFVTKANTTNWHTNCCRVSRLQYSKNSLESKEFPRSRSNPGHHYECYLAMVWNITNGQRNSRWPRDQIWSCGGGTDLPPIGQHGENSIHRQNRSIATDPTVETEYREMLFRLETEHSDKELYQIIAQ